MSDSRVVAGDEMGVIDEEVWFRQRHFYSLEQDFQRFALGCVFARASQEEANVIEAAPRESVYHLWMPRGMHRPKSAQIEVEGQSFQPWHPYLMPLALRIVVILEVIKRALVHRPVLAASIAQPVPVRITAATIWIRRVEVDGVQFMVAHQAERVATVAHGFYSPQRIADTAGQEVAGFWVDQVAKEERLVTGWRDERAAVVSVSHALHEGAELVEAAVDVGDRRFPRVHGRPPGEHSDRIAGERDRLADHPALGRHPEDSWKHNGGNGADENR